MEWADPKQPQTPSSTTREYVRINDELWERLIELTDGAAALCYQCGVCTAICPWGLVLDEPLSVRSFMRHAQIGLGGGNHSLWYCTTCAQCQAYCPRGVDISQVFRSLRTIAWEQRNVEHGLPSLLWSVYWNGNPWSQPPSQRTAWVKDLTLPSFDPARHEILLYVGCTSSYDRRAQKIARALAMLLDAAGVKFGYLGENEPCCGEAVLSVGHQPYFQEIAHQTLQCLHQRGVTDLVTISPHCYDVFKNHYPTLNQPNQQADWSRSGPVSFGSFRDGQEYRVSAQHYTQYLATLVEQGRLNFNHPLEVKVTFQDPCYLGRHNQEYQAPRQVLEAIPGLELIEMEHHAVDGLCCGGGGGRMWLETKAGERFADLRVQEANQTGAQTLVTACPFCLVCLEDSAKTCRYPGDRPSRQVPVLSGLNVMDIAEIAVMAL